MAIDGLRDLVGEWELTVNLPGAQDIPAHVVFERMGEVLVQRTVVPVPAVPDSCCMVMSQHAGGYVQHYFDARGVARLYEMTFDGRTWTLERTKPDFTALDFGQRFIGELPHDASAINGEWQISGNGGEWKTDFTLTYRRTS